MGERERCGRSVRELGGVEGRDVVLGRGVERQGEAAMNGGSERACG